MARFMLTIESMGIWPAQLMIVLMHLIPKETGGRRPIGLVASFIRLWERVRAPLIRQWRIRSHRGYNWAAPGRNAERAAWIQSIASEAARFRGLESASFLIDMVKAFDSIPLELLWERGQRHGFPLQVLRLVLEICASPRRLVFKGAVSQVVVTESAVVAGLVMAVDLMFLAVVDTMDSISVNHPQVDPLTYVDDITLSCSGAAEVVKRCLALAAADCVNQLEGVCSMVVSRAGRWRKDDKAKSIAVASTRNMRRLLAPGLRALGVKVGRQAKLLGVDYIPGKVKGVRRPAQQARIDKAMAKRRRIMKLGSRGGSHVINTGLIPMIKYGASVTGVTCRVVRQVGSMAAEALGPTAGRSATARLAVRGMDPRVGLILRPVRAWMEEVWRGEVARDDLHAAWMQAQTTVGLSTQPHRAAHSAAASYVAALARIGWKSPAVDAVITREGNLLRLGDVDVVMMMRMAVDDLGTKIALDSEVAKDFADDAGVRGHFRTLPGDGGDGAAVTAAQSAAGPTHVAGSTSFEAQSARVWRGGRYRIENGKMIPWFTPASIVLKHRLRKPHRCTPADRSAAAMVEGGWWTRSRLAALGMRDDPICDACGVAVGTLWHRLGECSATKEEREGRLGCPRWLLKKGKTSPWDPLFTRGVPAMPRVPPPPPYIVQWGPEGQPDGGAAASGDVYTDGALAGRWRRIMRGGWAVVALRADADQPAWVMLGTCPDLLPSVVRSELRAVLEALRLAVVPLCIHVDNREVVDGFKLGEQWCTQPGRDGADLWRSIWAKMRDIGDGVDVVKVKAHTDLSDIDDGVITARDRVGNFLADAAARKGARLAELASPTGPARAELAKAIRWHNWSRRLAAVWVDDTGGRGDAEGAVPRVREERATRKGKGGGLRHLLWEKAGDLTCRRCGREARTALKLKDLQSSRCLGSAAGRLLARACLDPLALSRYCVLSRGDLERRGWTARSVEDRAAVPPDLRGDWFDEGDDLHEDAEPLTEDHTGHESAVVDDVREQMDEGDIGRDLRAEQTAEGDIGQRGVTDEGEDQELEDVTGSGHTGASSTGSMVVSGISGRMPQARVRSGEDESEDHDAAADRDVATLAGADAGAAATPIWMRDPDWLYLPHLQHRHPPRQRSPSGHGGDHARAIGGHASERANAIGDDAAATSHSPSASSTMAWIPLAGTATGGETHLVHKRILQDSSVPSASSSSSPGTWGTTARAVRRRTGEATVVGAKRPALVQEATSRQVRARVSMAAAEVPGQGGDQRDVHHGGDNAEVPLPGAEVSSPLELARPCGRRYVAHVADPIDVADAQGHRLCVTGSLIWCAKCGRYAERRLGKALKSQCVGKAEGVYASRLEKLRGGRHPISGDFIGID